jgi:chromosome partitioning protein
LSTHIVGEVSPSDVSRETVDLVSRETAPEETPIAAAAAAALGVIQGHAKQPFPRPASPRIMAVANQKGGVGKTTTAVNVAAALAMRGASVLCLDLDPQGNASTGFGVEHGPGTPSMYEVVVDGVPLTDVIVPAGEIPNLLVAPSTIDLAGAEVELVAAERREFRLADALDQAGRAGLTVDYTIIDCPPSLGLLTLNALTAAREVVIPIQCEYYALEGLGQLLRNIDLVKAHLNPGLAISTILLTMYDGRTRLAEQVAEDVRAHFGDAVLSTEVPRSVRVAEAPSYGRPVLTYDPLSRGATAYVDAAREIAERGALVNGAPPAGAVSATAGVSGAAPDVAPGGAS